jgi:hypothetical protein
MTTCARWYLLPILNKKPLHESGMFMISCVSAVTFMCQKTCGMKLTSLSCAERKQACLTKHNCKLAQAGSSPATTDDERAHGGGRLPNCRQSRLSVTVTSHNSVGMVTCQLRELSKEKWRRGALSRTLTLHRQVVTGEAARAACVRVFRWRTGRSLASQERHLKGGKINLSIT